LKAIKKTEIFILKNSFKQIIIIFNRGEMEKSAATILLKTVFDRIIYDNNISREINLRSEDLTLRLNHPNKFKYLFSILGKQKNDF
tara:strand:- start:179 stop:436 length:258 start_codon:yes stop_codon:yes gene_type:complete